MQLLLVEDDRDLRRFLSKALGVVASLYPAVTVLLAALVLRERIYGTQGVGLALATTAVLIAWG